jgi:hypothetical protein
VTKTFRGSRKHLLNLLDGPDYPSTLQRILTAAGVALTAQDARQPVGCTDPAEWELPRFCQTHCTSWLDADTAFTGWWVHHDGTLPTWDLISTCQIEGRPGLLLVEAKAHESELDRRGKALAETASRESKENHSAITQCIERVCASMRVAVDSRIAVTASSHYQLSNRIAWAWRVSERGVPVVLLYLGFLGDSYFADGFVDDGHWQRTLGAYIDGVVPLGLPGHTIKPPGGGFFLMLSKSLPVSEVSVK